MSEREMVKQFHEAMGLSVRERPTIPPEVELAMRARMAVEEALEFAEASGFTVYVNGKPLLGQYQFEIRKTHAPRLHDMVRETVDRLYIAHGDLLTCGVDLKAFAEVHRANMSKPGPDGRPMVREDGKVLKGPNYRPPDIAGVLRQAEHPGMCIGGAYCTCSTRG